MERHDANQTLGAKQQRMKGKGRFLHGEHGPRFSAEKHAVTILPMAFYAINKWDVNKQVWVCLEDAEGGQGGRPVWEPSVEDASWGKIPSLRRLPQPRWEMMDDSLVCSTGTEKKKYTQKDTERVELIKLL